MKKTYIKPETLLVNLKTESMILASSMMPVDPEPSTPAARQDSWAEWESIW